jgi:hypothetical protein
MCYVNKLINRGTCLSLWSEIQAIDSVERSMGEAFQSPHSHIKDIMYIFMYELFVILHCYPGGFLSTVCMCTFPCFNEVSLMLFSLTTDGRC